MLKDSDIPKIPESVSTFNCFSICLQSTCSYIFTIRSILFQFTVFNCFCFIIFYMHKVDFPRIILHFYAIFTFFLAPFHVN